MTDQELKLRNELSRLDGYMDAVRDFGIWKDGIQTIGCRETPIKEIEEEIRLKMKKIRESL